MRILGRWKGGGCGARRGSVIVMALVMMTGLLVLAAGMHTISRGASTEVHHSEDDARARALAESGIAEAMLSLRAGSSGNVGTQATPAYLAGGLFWVTATPTGVTGQTRLVSTAMVGTGRAAVEVVVELQAPGQPLFYAVLNSRLALPLASGVLIDSFDSEAGTYASQALNTANSQTYALANGDVSSNAGISMASGGTLMGDAIPGPGYSVSMSTGCYISGAQTPAPTPFSFPPIVMPNIPVTGPYSVPMNGTQSLPAGNYGFSSLTIGKSANLTVTGPSTIYVSGNFSGGQTGRLKVDATNGPVTFYIQGTYAVSNGFENQPVPGSPMAVAFMIDGTGSVSFQSGSMIRGAYYMPNMDVQFTSNCEVWGSFGANQIGMSASTKFHYDEALMKHWQTGNGGVSQDPLQLLAWSLAPVLPADLARSRTDPFTLLGVSPQNLLSPEAAWIP